MLDGLGAVEMAGGISSVNFVKVNGTLDEVGRSCKEKKAHDLEEDEE